MTTNSPNPVDGDVQALIERLNRIAARLKWNNVGYAQDVLKAVDLLTTPPDQLLRPVELPMVKTVRSNWSTWNWIEHLGGRFQNGNPGDYIEFGSVYAVAQMLKQYRRTVTAEVIKEIAESLRQQGYEVKND